MDERYYKVIEEIKMASRGLGVLDAIREIEKAGTMEEVRIIIDGLRGSVIN